ncbi:MAG TPA: MerR family transcriptional regulator [Desulfobacterales bacterium]|nr:MerR family transcriptional regulator [Desulfobacterales bacterium]
MAEAKEHLLSIKEASRLTGVPAYTLRFWEKEFQDFLRPPRTPGGQRRFDKKSLEMIQRIKHLVDEEKYSIAGARGVLAMEQQQTAQRSNIAVRLRNEEQIDLILDEIAEIVREKVLARLLRDEGSNNVVGQRVPGLTASQVAQRAAAPVQPADNESNTQESSTETSSTPRPETHQVEPYRPSPRPVGIRPEQNASPAAPSMGSASNNPIRQSFGPVIPQPNITET